MAGAHLFSMMTDRKKRIVGCGQNFFPNAFCGERCSKAMIRPKFRAPQQHVHRDKKPRHQQKWNSAHAVIGSERSRFGRAAVASGRRMDWPAPGPPAGGDKCGETPPAP